MSNTLYCLLTILALCAMSLATRLLPFLFGDHLAKNKHLLYVGGSLPAAIMVLLIAFELEPVKWSHYPHGLPQLGCLALTGLLQAKYHNMLLSISVGAGCFVVLQYLI